MALRVQAVDSVRFNATIVVDTREQIPYSFVGLRGPTKIGRPLIVVDTARGTLKTGDYSLAGHTHVVAVERKSVADLYGTLARGRDRFERELARLDEMAVVAVVVEGEWSEVLAYPAKVGGRLSASSIFRSVLAWQQRYSRVHWWLCPGRDLAEATTFRILERYWTDHTKAAEAAGDVTA